MPSHRTLFVMLDPTHTLCVSVDSVHTKAQAAYLDCAESCGSNERVLDSSSTAVHYVVQARSALLALCHPYGECLQRQSHDLDIGARFLSKRAFIFLQALPCVL